MDLRLTGQVALITGASRGIGRAIATALAVEGCQLALLARGREALTQVAEELRQKGAMVMIISADLYKMDEITSAVQQVLAHYGHVDILVHNAGGAQGTTIFDTSAEDWHDALTLNVLALSHLAQLVVPGMQAHGGGRIIAISSIFGRESGGRVAYNALKAASISLTKSLARQLAPYHILVNSVAPGSLLFPGSSWERRLQVEPERIAAFVKSDLPLGRFGTPQEVAAVVIFLSSPLASLVTGACLVVDGGQSRSNI